MFVVYVCSIYVYSILCASSFLFPDLLVYSISFGDVSNLLLIIRIIFINLKGPREAGTQYYDPVPECINPKAF